MLTTEELADEIIALAETDLPKALEMLQEIRENEQSNRI